MKPWGIFLDDALKLLASIDILSQTPVAPVKIYASLSLQSRTVGLSQLSRTLIKKTSTRRQASLTSRTFGFHELMKCLLSFTNTLIWADWDHSHREAQQSLGISLKLTSGGVQNADSKEITYTHTIYSWGLIVLYVNLLPRVMMSTIVTVLVASTFGSSSYGIYSKQGFGLLLQTTNRQSLLKVLKDS